MSIARIGRIISTDTIDKADMIDQASVSLGSHGVWHGVIGKNQFVAGELVEVYTQDAKLPDEPRFEFMRKHNFIVRMLRLRGVPSECVIAKLTVAGNEGDDIMDLVGAEKYVKPLPPCLDGEALGYFPSFIPKTDELNFQEVPHLVAALQGNPYYNTDKVDGTSATVYFHNGHFGVCGRRVEFIEDEKNTMWRIAKVYNLEETLKSMNVNIAIQFEVVGPGVQKNNLKLKSIEPRVFDIYDIGAHEYYDLRMMEFVCNRIGIPTVNIVERGESFEYTDNNTLQKIAEGKYPGAGQREGIVIRSQDVMRVDNDRISFKVLNLKYK